MTELMHGQYVFMQTINKGMQPLFCNRKAIWFRDLLRRQQSINITIARERKNKAFLIENKESIQRLYAHVKELNNKDVYGALELCDSEDTLEQIVNNQ
jgi:hypothetical protein